MVFILFTITCFSLVACIFLYLCARKYEKKIDELTSENNRVRETNYITSSKINKKEITPSSCKSTTKKKLTIDDIKVYPPYDKNHIEEMNLINEDTKRRIKKDLESGLFGEWSKEEVNTWYNTILDDAEHHVFDSHTNFKPKKCRNEHFSYSLYRYSSKRPGDIWIGLNNCIKDPVLTSCVLPQMERYKYYRIKDVLNNERENN